MPEQQIGNLSILQIPKNFHNKVDIPFKVPFRPAVHIQTHTGVHTHPGAQKHKWTSEAISVIVLTWETVPERPWGLMWVKRVHVSVHARECVYVCVCVCVCVCVLCRLALVALQLYTYGSFLSFIFQWKADVKQQLGGWLVECLGNGEV